MDTTRPNRPMMQIYLEAAKAAETLAEKAEDIGDIATEASDKMACSDYVQVSRKFAESAKKAADTTITLMNDGTLKAHAQAFDRMFEKFVRFAGAAEQDLELIKQRNKQ